MAVRQCKPGECCWVLSSALADDDPLMRREALYCGAPTSRRYEISDDGKRVRKYATFCEMHQRIIDIEEVYDE